MKPSRTNPSKGSGQAPSTASGQASETAAPTAAWLTGQGHEADIVLSSRMRLARNIAGFHFLSRMSPAQQQQVTALARDAILAASLAGDMTWVSIDEMSELDREVLVEKHLISKELARGEGPRGVAVAGNESLSVMVNEEDHLRLQALSSGFEPDGVWTQICGADDALAARLPYAFSKEFGYLTACPTNVGTGLRVSVMLHLPGMVIARHLEKVFNAVAKLNLVVRGLYGEGTQATGDLYQLSNQRSLGKSEEEIISNLAAVVPQITEYERQIRQAILKQDRTLLEDQVWRAFGILTSARSISSEEALYLLSRLRLGVNLGLMETPDIATINRLLLQTRPACLQKVYGRKLAVEERNRCRADFVRSALLRGHKAATEGKPDEERSGRH